MKPLTALVLAAVAVPAAFGAGDASAQNRCPYIQPHEDAIARARSLKSQRASTNDVPTLCQLLPQLAAVHDELASNLEMAANHPGCREQGGGANASVLRQYAQENRQAAAQCSAALDADPARRSSGGCGSDITGTKGGSPAPRRNCDSARNMRREARTATRSQPAVAKRLYREAADEYVAAGDFNLAAVVLRELAALDSPSAAASGRSGTPPDASSGGRGTAFKMWRPTKDNPDCESASNVDRTTAAYYNTCVDPEPAKPVRRYQHPIASIDLLRVAHAKCGSASRENYECYVDAKVAYLLANDARIRAQCEGEAASARRPSLRDELAASLGRTIDRESQAKDALTSCVDREYLYGPNGPPSLRDVMKARMKSAGVGAASSENYKTRPPPAGASHCRPGAGWAPHPCCQAGFGMKPTPGGSGSWTCQQLGTFDLGNAKDVEDSDRRVDTVALLAVTAADRNLSGQVDEAVREKCAVPVLAAVRSVMKGGMPIVPERCKGFADAARGELAYYASRHVDRGKADIEELLAYLPSGQLGPPQPGVQDLTPDRRMLRQAECMARGGTAENCAALDETSNTSAQSAPPQFVRGGISP